MRQLKSRKWSENLHETSVRRRQYGFNVPHYPWHVGMDRHLSVDRGSAMTSPLGANAVLLCEFRPPVVETPARVKPLLGAVTWSHLGNDTPIIR